MFCSRSNPGVVTPLLRGPLCTSVVCEVFCPWALSLVDLRAAWCGPDWLRNDTCGELATAGLWSHDRSTVLGREHLLPGEEPSEGVLAVLSIEGPMGDRPPAVFGAAPSDSPVSPCGRRGLGDAEGLLWAAQ